MTKELHTAADRLIQMALREDVGKRDVTTDVSIPKEKKARGKIIFREKGVAAGLWIVPLIFKRLDRRVKIRVVAKEGKIAKKNQTVVVLEGSARSILTGERIALNFLAHLSGVATLTRRYVEIAKPFGAQILATRKTTPGWRLLEKYALRMGGGQDHRMGLYDQVLVKENHLQLRSASDERKGLKEWVAKIKKKVPRGMKIEVEAQSFREFLQLLSSKTDIILLDNLSVSEIRRAVLLRKGKRPLLGVSGGVTLENVRQIAKTGVERISVGRLTHSTPSVNISMDFEEIHGGKI